MAAYWIAQVDITDADAYGKYAALGSRVVESYGGEFLARGTRTVFLEGRERARNVVIEFPSLEDAARCYASDEYQSALALAGGAFVRDLCIIDGA